MKDLTVSEIERLNTYIELLEGVFLFIDESAETIVALAQVEQRS